MAATPAAGITTVAGVRTQVVVRDLPRPTAVAVDDRGGMWATSSGNFPLASDGVWYAPRPGAKPRQVVKGLSLALGLTWHRGVLYVAHVTPSSTSVADIARRQGRIVALSGWNGTRFRSQRVLLGGLPVGLHTIDNVVAGPDGFLYVGLGSASNAQRGSSGLSSSILKVDPRARKPRATVVARGLRNPYGLAFIPGTPWLVVTDNGRDDLGNDRPPDEVNLVDTSTAARDYGFPGCWGQGGAACTTSVAPVVGTAPHASTDGVAVVPRFGRFGLSAFVASNGSSLFEKPVTTRVERVELTPLERGGYTGRLLPFAWGFRRFDPLGMTSDRKGAVYLTLWQSGQLVRFTPKR